jgi:hypothetical protein
LSAQAAWCSTLINPGQYTLLVEFTDALHPGPTLTAKCSFEVSPPNSEELRQALSQAAATISDNHASGQERSIAIDVLRFLRNPESIDFIRPILSDQQAQSFIKEPLVKGLALIDHVDAARLLIEIYTKSDSNSQLQNTAVCALHDLQGRTKREDVRVTLDNFMRGHPRSCAKIID